MQGAVQPRRCIHLTQNLQVRPMSRESAVKSGLAQPAHGDTFRPMVTRTKVHQRRDLRRRVSLYQRRDPSRGTPHTPVCCSPVLIRYDYRCLFTVCRKMCAELIGFAHVFLLVLLCRVRGGCGTAHLQIGLAQIKRASWGAINQLDKLMRLCLENEMLQ